MKYTSYILGVVCGIIFGFAIVDIIWTETNVIDPSGIRSISCQRLCRKHDMRVLAKDPAPMIGCICERKK